MATSLFKKTILRDNGVVLMVRTHTICSLCRPKIRSCFSPKQQTW